jgi:hemin uptake protein HemP
VENSENQHKNTENPMPQAGLVIEAQELLGGKNEIHIRHDGQIYRLRITSRNKLILQK